MWQFGKWLRVEGPWAEETVGELVPFAEGTNGEEGRGSAGQATEEGLLTWAMEREKSHLGDTVPEIATCLFALIGGSMLS